VSTPKTRLPGIGIVRIDIGSISRGWSNFSRIGA